MSDGGKDRPDTLQVRYEKCESCIFITKYPLSTRQRIFSEIGPDGAIACHQYSTEDEDGEEVDSTVMCRGFYDQDPYHNAYMRLSAQLGKVEFVDDEGEPIACPIPQTMAQIKYHPKRQKRERTPGSTSDTRTLENLSDA